MFKIKMMADYDCFPLWWDGMEEVGNIDPILLPISKELINELNSWAEEYNKTLNQEYPPDSCFESDEIELLFKDKGKYLCDRLKSELGNTFSVIFYP